MKKYDIGVLGWWYGENYGSMLTYYALHQALKKMGYSVLMLHEALGYNNWRVKWKNDIAPMRFAKKHYNITEQCHYSEMKKYNDVCDTFICGSDQLWNYHIGRVNDDCFLDFVNDDKKRISYATSFGNRGSNRKGIWKPERVEKNKASLQKFDAISVREDYAVEIAHNVFGVEAQQVLDPVFLLQREDYDVLAEQAAVKIEGEYLYAFILDPTEEKKTTIQEIANKLGIKKIVVITDGSPKAQVLCHNVFPDFLNIDDISPENYLCTMKNAKYVITDSFHGTCFAYIFQKNFSVFYNEKRGADRFEYLLHLMGLEHRRIYPGNSEGILGSIDFTKTNERVNDERLKSYNWLKTALQYEKNIFSPFYGTNTYKTKSDEDFSVCSKIKCTGCTACFNVCNVNAISMIEDKEGFLYPNINGDRCINCGKCTKVCPILNPTNKIKKNKPPKKVFAAYSLNSEVRYMSTSGGVTSEIALNILQKNGVCYGAAYDDKFNVNHIRVDKESNLVKLRQSKYYQSIIGDIFVQVREDLNKKRFVLFCGTPCQCAGLSSFLGREYNTLLIVDFVCHSICSPKAFREYLKEKESERNAKAMGVWFKNKELGWHNFSMRIDFENADAYRERWVNDSFFLGFLKYRCFLRPACHDCHFKEYKRASDITVADFWGLTWNNPENIDDQENGVTALMINTTKGHDLFSAIKSRLYSEQHTVEEILPKNGGLVKSQRVGLYRDFFFKCLGNVPFSKIIKAMEMREKNLAEQKKISTQIHTKSSNNIVGKLKKIGNVVINMHPTSKIIIDGELICNYNLPKGSQKECILILHKNSTLIVNSIFRICYDSVLQIFDGATLTLNKGLVNAGAIFGIKRNTVIGNDFLAGRNLVVYDSDHHLIVQGSEETPINNNGRVPIKIGNHVWCGINVTLLKEINIGDGSIIGAGAIVTKDIPSRCLAVGSPAKIVKTDVTWKG